MRTLRLQTPMMHGDDVKKVQKALAGANAWKKNFHPGSIDGVYGPHTAKAVSDAKWFMGYPKRDTNAGDTFYKFITGKAPLPLRYRARMKYRQSVAAKRIEMRKKAGARMKSRHGLAESPEGSNKNWLVTWYYSRKGASAAWCNIDVTEAYVYAGSKAFVRGSKFAYVPFMEAATKDPNSGLIRIKKDDVSEFDIVTFDFDGGEADHTGLFLKWANAAKTEFYCEEGNTDSAGGAEGGQQLTKKRNVSQVSMFIRVQK